MCAPKRKSARRRYRVNLIKETYLYDTNEIAKLFGLHRNTVRHWSKEGLRPIDDRRPILVHGSDLKAFLAQRQEARRQKCASGEFFCFRCREPRRPWGNLVEVTPHTQKISKLTAICCICETEMHRTINRAAVSNFLAAAEQRSVDPERLTGSSDPIENCDLEKAKLDVETEPAE
jgi:Helix-turn-helix domain